jgi:hypothetical protein
LASISESVAEKMDSGGAASAMALAVSSSVGGGGEVASLREARPNIASKGLAGKWWFSLAILLHFLHFVFNHNGFIDHVLEVGIIRVEQLELNIIIQPI